MRDIVPETNTQEQIVLLKYPNFLLNFDTYGGEIVLLKYPNFLLNFDTYAGANRRVKIS